MTRNYLIASVALVAMIPAGSAEAFDWTGFYLGVNAGYGADTTHQEFQSAGGPAGSSIEFDRAGGFVGLTAGANHSGGVIVLGIEGDIAHAEMRGVDLGNDAVGCFGTDCYSSIEWFATLRGRAGLDLVGFMPYVTAGLATGAVNVTFDNAEYFDRTVQQTGWTAGVGVEAAVSDSLTVKGEYRYVDLGLYDEFYENPASVREQFSFHALSLGANWHF